METTTSFAITKTLFGGLTIGVILDYFGMRGEMLTILSILLLLDFVFGVVRARYNDKSTVTSKNMTKGLARKLTRWSLPFIGVLILKGAGIENTKALSDTIMAMLVIAEGYSIIRHIYNINTGKDLPEMDVFDILMRKLGEFLLSKTPELPKKPLDPKQGE